MYVYKICIQIVIEILEVTNLLPSLKSYFIHNENITYKTVIRHSNEL